MSKSIFWGALLFFYAFIFGIFLHQSPGQNAASATYLFGEAFAFSLIVAGSTGIITGVVHIFHRKLSSSMWTWTVLLLVSSSLVAVTRYQLQDYKSSQGFMSEHTYSEELKTKLTAWAEQSNRHLPQTFLKGLLRWDHVTVGQSEILLNLTMMREDLVDQNSPAWGYFESRMKSFVLEYLLKCTDDKIISLVQEAQVLKYQFHNRIGQKVAVIAITSRDCGLVSSSKK